MHTNDTYKKTKIQLINEIIKLNNKFDDFHLNVLNNYELKMILELLIENKNLKRRKI